MKHGRLHDDSWNGLFRQIRAGNNDKTTVAGKGILLAMCHLPWLWLLTRTSDCRIFQNQKVPDIIKQVFRDLGFSDFEDALSRSYREWEYWSACMACKRSTVRSRLAPPHSKASIAGLTFRRFHCPLRLVA